LIRILNNTYLYINKRPIYFVDHETAILLSVLLSGATTANAETPLSLSEKLNLLNITNAQSPAECAKSLTYKALRTAGYNVTAKLQAKHHSNAKTQEEYYKITGVIFPKDRIKNAPLPASSAPVEIEGTISIDYTYDKYGRPALYEGCSIEQKNGYPLIRVKNAKTKILLIDETPAPYKPNSISRPSPKRSIY
jgi:hypothetical protein